MGADEAFEVAAEEAGHIAAHILAGDGAAVRGKQLVGICENRRYGPACILPFVN